MMAMTAIVPNTAPRIAAAKFGDEDSLDVLLPAIDAAASVGEGEVLTPRIVSIIDTSVVTAPAPSATGLCEGPALCLRRREYLPQATLKCAAFKVITYARWGYGKTHYQSNVSPFLNTTLLFSQAVAKLHRDGREDAEGQQAAKLDDVTKTSPLAQDTGIASRFH
ncbi:hypothetical protein AAE478_004083 [Parahypoxylon ruwenzoriense]